MCDHVCLVPGPLCHWKFELGHSVQVGGFLVGCSPGLVVCLRGLFAVVHHSAQAVVEVLRQVLAAFQLL